uniref:Fibrinogen C-terminal domain-containing protein n=1 Tax=Amphimedon queenslandica TaxID=400682 RepID=A0A1X7U7U0_AMPQE
MEIDDNKNLYEVEHEYDGKDDFPERPLPNLQIHDTVPAGRKTLFVLLGIQAFIILILIILLGMNGVTLTQLNVADTCDCTGASTGGIVSSNGDSCSQILNLTRELLSQRDNDTRNLIQDLANSTNKQTGILSQVTQQLGSTEAKVDDIRSAMDEQLVNISDILNQVQQATGLSAQRLVNIITTLSNIKDTATSTAGVTDDLLIMVGEILQFQNVSSLFNSLIPVSCKDVKAALPNSPSGWYNLNNQNTYCNMDQLCGSGGGWTRLAYLDMSDATQNCPTGFRLYTLGGKRYCGRPESNSRSCSSASFSTNGIGYSQICGRVEGFAKTSPDGIFAGNNQRNNIDSSYVDGVSITRGSPRQHVWTFIATIQTSIIAGGVYNCPCSPGSTQQVPSFIGSNYYCEGGSADPLWDGQDCLPIETNCCSSTYLPWFYRNLNTATTDYVELRVCGDQSTGDEDVPVGLYEIYVK